MEWPLGSLFVCVFHMCYCKEEVFVRLPASETTSMPCFYKMIIRLEKKEYRRSIKHGHQLYRKHMFMLSYVIIKSYSLLNYEFIYQVGKIHWYSSSPYGALFQHAIMLLYYIIRKHAHTFMGL